MISRELAKRLKEAGLGRTLERGDWFIPYSSTRPCVAPDDFRTGWLDLWLPSRSQLLSEIEKRGFGWTLTSQGVFDLEEEYECCIYETPNQEGCAGVHRASVSEDACAKALLKIIGKKI